MNFLKGYKTVIFNALVIVASLAQYLDMLQLIKPEYVPLATLAIGIANTALRWGTDTGIFANKAA